LNSWGVFGLKSELDEIFNKSQILTYNNFKNLTF
jgi:hypothetical protein